MFSVVRGLGFNNRQDVAFRHDQHFFIVDLLRFNTVAIVENNDIADFHVQRLYGTVVQDATLTDSDDFATS